jgi:hypothetical protein
VQRKDGWSRERAAEPTVRLGGRKRRIKEREIEEKGKRSSEKGEKWVTENIGTSGQNKNVK